MMENWNDGRLKEWKNEFPVSFEQLQIKNFKKNEIAKPCKHTGRKKNRAFFGYPVSLSFLFTEILLHHAF
jgi:hypothetical protein